MSSAALDHLRSLPAGTSPGRRVQAFEDWFREACLEGSPPDALTHRIRDEAERFWSYTIPGLDGHLYWNGPWPFRTNDGRQRRPARWVWLHTRGSLPEPHIAVRPVCGEPNCIAAAHLALSTSRERERLYSDEACLGALQVAAGRLGHPPSTEEWRAHGHRPSYALLIQRFTSWENALRRAGLDPAERPTPHRPRLHSDSSLLQALRDYHAESGKTSSLAYMRWARERGAPGLKTIERRFGGWVAAKQAAGL